MHKVANGVGLFPHRYLLLLGFGPERGDLGVEVRLLRLELLGLVQLLLLWAVASVLLSVLAPGESVQATGQAHLHAFSEVLLEGVDLLAQLLRLELGCRTESCQLEQPAYAL